MQRQYEQMRVGLDEILFNDDNPREEMGDLGAPEGTPSEIRAALTDEAVLGQLVAKVGGEADGDAR